jgi:Zn-dependent M16 (insulinase) family peptidase
MKEYTETRQPAVTLSINEVIHGFRVQDRTPLPGIRSVAYRLEHEKSGARLLHLHTGDQENLLAIAFRTPPPDDTGLPHILEHTVLCGSRKYPVKDPFVELLKTSLATFLNAMTYPDKTVYPCASMVEKDFFNLAGVYCDAVFHPLLTEAHFKQEGHHYEFLKTDNPDSPLIVKGVVYNEMKGAYSDLDGIIARMTSRSICPDNAYGRDSGGDPDAIPSLTYAQFTDFHRTFYHPSNSFIFLYGDIPTERHLAFLDDVCLRGFTRIPVDTTITAQPRWAQPSRETLMFPIGAHEDPSRKAATVVTFLTNDVTDALRSLSMNVIEYYLLGNAASPLRKALIDSRLGEELTSSGYADYQRDTYFTVGLKGCSADSADAVVDLILDTCARLVREGFEKDKIESAFHRLQLSSREIGSQYPLRLMDRVYRSWIYDADSLHNLRLNEHLAELRRRYASEERFFERQLAEMIVDNSHYSVLTFVPDKTYIAGRQEAFEKKMARMKAEMGTAALEQIAREAIELDAMQSAPNPPDAVATLPRLTLADIPVEPRELATKAFEVSGRPFLYTDIFSNGLNYLTIAFDLRGIDDELIDYLALYAEALTKMGAGEDDYVAMAEREAAATGGVSVGISADGHIDNPAHVQPFFTVSSKALDAKLPVMLDVISDRILRCDLTDIDRLKDVVLQGRVYRRSAIIPAGNHFAAIYAARNLSRNGAISERVGGITQVRFFDHIAEHFDAMRDEIVEKLDRIRDFLLASGRVSASFVGDFEQFERTRDFLSVFLHKLREETPPEVRGSFSPVPGTRDGLATPADVAFVAQAFPAIGAVHADAPAVQLLCIQLSLGYLWEEIRMKRGAYGARAGFSPLNGVLSLSSYRDPFIKETLDAFSGVFRHVENNLDLTPWAVEQAIIGTVKTLDRVIRPGKAVGLALGQYLCGETKEFRKSFRARLLALTGEDLRRVNAEIHAPALKDAPVCVISSREKLAAANEAMGESGLTITDL